MRIFTLFVMSILLSSCAGQTAQEKDSRADAALGLAYEEGGQDEEARTALNDYQDKQIQEQKRNLERQVTDPLA